MGLSEKERELYASKVLDLGNLSMAGLVFGHIIAGREIQVSIIIAGVVFYVASLLISHSLHKGR